MKKMDLYTIDPSYYQYLSKIDNKIAQSNKRKGRRPFVGVIIRIEEVAFFAPLTSPKVKHKKMKNTVDFHKMDGGNLGAINFNNMIPIPEECAVKIDLKILLTDMEEDKKYKLLMQNQKDWCNLHKETLQKKGEKLYNDYLSGKLSASIRNRCCDFLIVIIKWLY